MAEADKLNIDSIIARLLEGKINEGQILLTKLMASYRIRLYLYKNILHIFDSFSTRCEAR